MKGQILDFSVQKNEGVITSADGSRYTFNGSEWKSDIQPNKEMWVDFEANESNATRIYISLRQPTTSNSGTKIKPAMT